MVIRYIIKKMEEENKESADPMAQIPEAMRGMFKKMLDDQI